MKIIEDYITEMEYTLVTSDVACDMVSIAIRTAKEGIYDQP